MNNPKTEEIVEALRCRAYGDACTEDCICYNNIDFDCASNFTALAAAADRLEALEAEVSRLKARQRWIPVTERLPEVSMRTLVSIDDCVGVAHFTHDISGMYFFSDHAGIPLTFVTHWMPLPEPPALDE